VLICGFCTINLNRAINLNHTTARSFNIANDQFIKDGKTFQIFAGCIHYSRVPSVYWADRLARLRAMGFNAIQTYVPWNFHEENEGDFNFEGDHDLPKFIQEAQAADLLVLLRAGPYMCGEWEFGGFPAWLLAKKPPITIRTFESGYISLVDKYWSVLLSTVKPLLYENGGPIIMVQVENEYGSYGNVASHPADKQYMEHLVSLGRKHLGDNVILYTTDGGNTGYMSRGTLKGSSVYSVGDFGPGSNPQTSFDAQKQFNAVGMSPPMCSEFYSGWLTHWGEKMANTSSHNLASSLDSLVGSKYKASFSMYMAFGGTNFGYWSGANGGGDSYQPHITSYDYDSPLSEGGDHGFGSDGIDKYQAVREVLIKYNPSPPEPTPIPKKSYGDFSLNLTATLFTNLDILSPGNLTHKGVPDVGSMESFGQNYGFILYSTQIPASLDPSTMTGTLQVTQVRDRVQIFVDGLPAGVIYRTSPKAITVPIGKKLDLLVENMGRLNYGGGMTDPKGITKEVTWNGKKISGNWTVHSLPLLFDSHIAHLPFVHSNPPKSARPVFYRGSLSISGSPTDTYLLSSGLGKGHMWINGFHLGRYWENKGPQHTLYVPRNVLKQGTNDLVVLELDKLLISPRRVMSVDAPDFKLDTHCDLGSAPKLDDNVVMYTCKNSYDSSQKWVLHSNGTVALMSNSQLCLTIGPKTDPSTGNLRTELRQCGVDKPSQTFTYHTDKTITNAKNNLCLDITSHLTIDGASVEVYSCNGGENQKWEMPTSSGHITSLQDGHCLTACPKIMKRQGMRGTGDER